MDLKNMGAIVGGLVVAVILLATVLAPIVNTSTAEIGTKTYTNEITPNNTLTEATDVTVTFSGTANDDIKISVNGVNYTISTTTASSTRIMLFYSDICQLFIDRIANTNIPVFGLKTANYTGILSEVDSEFTFTATNNETSLVVNDVETFSGTIEKFAYAYAEDNGEYLFTPTTTADLKMSADAPIDVISIGGWWANTYVTYTATAEEWYNSTTTPIEGLTITKDVTSVEYDATFTATLVDNGDETYSFSNGIISYAYTANGTESTGTTAMFVVAPIEYEAYNETTVTSLLGIIPMLVTVGIILGIVGMAFSRRE